MGNIYTLMAMLFLHIVDDYYLQGFLASAKQKSWWNSNHPEKRYENDYICALMTHAFSWAFMTMLPLAITLSFKITPLFFLLFCLNWTIHGIVDDQKANKLSINLIQDQIIHVIQIIVTFVLMSAL